MPRSAVHRRAGWFPRSCPTSTWIGWTHLSRRFSYRNIPEEYAENAILRTTGCKARLHGLATAVIMPRCGRCASSYAVCRPRTPGIRATGGCVT